MATITYLAPALEAHVARATERINRERSLKRACILATLLGGVVVLALITGASFGATPRVEAAAHAAPAGVAR